MKKARVELILDIGSASVGASLVAFREGEKPTLSHTKRAPLRVDSGESLGGIQTLAIAALNKALEGMPHALRPEVAQIVFAAPWYASDIKTVLSDSPKPLKIGRATVTHALATQRQKDAKALGTGRHALESIVSQVYVNGYPTALRSAVRGTSLKVSLYESEADLSFVRAVTESVRNAYPHIRIDFHTFPFAAFAALRALRKEENFILIDVGGEITDVAITDRGALRFIGSFPKGALSFARAIAGKGSIADAISRLTLFVRGELSPEENATFSKTFERIAAEWNEGYGRVLESALRAAPMPHTAFLLADKDALQWFQKVLSLRSDSLPIRPLSVVPSFFESYVALGEDGAYDPFIALESLFISMGEEELIRA